MATYEGTCKLTDKKEIIWFDVIPFRTLYNPNGIAVDMMRDCTVRRRTGCNMCENCNLYREIRDVYKLLIN